MVAQDPGARGGVAFVGEPAFASGLLLAGLVEAIEGHALDLPSLMIDGRDIGIFYRQRVPVVGGWIREPALVFEHQVGLRGLAPDPGGDRAHHDGPTREHEEAHHELVYRGP